MSWNKRKETRQERQAPKFIVWTKAKKQGKKAWPSQAPKQESKKKEKERKQGRKKENEEGRKQRRIQRERQAKEKERETLNIILKKTNQKNKKTQKQPKEGLGPSEVAQTKGHQPNMAPTRTCFRANLGPQPETGANVNLASCTRIWEI